MLPTTAKLHYNFGVRDLSCISQGIMMSHRDVENEPLVLAQLWKHECTRVLNDKLNMAEDKMWYDKAIQQTVVEYFGDELAGSAKTPTYWVDFLREPVLDQGKGEGIESPIIYEPAEALEALRQRLLNRRIRFNDSNKIRKLDLMLFDVAPRHFVRISRVLSMARGSIMLVRVGGSGKQPLTRLSSFTRGQKAVQDHRHGEL